MPIANTFPLPQPLPFQAEAGCPLASFGLAVLGVLSLKGFLALQLGLDGYTTLTQALAQGDMLARATGQALTLDPVSLHAVERLLALVG